MLKKKNLLSWVTTAFFIVVGNFICSLGIKLFLEPAGLAAGGTTGIALILENYLNMPMSYFVFIFNMIMLVLGYFALGKHFAVSTLASSFLYPAFLEILDRAIGDFVLTDDRLLCAGFAAVFLGVGLGILIRNGASTGGMDIPPLVIKKYCHIPVSISMYAFDVCIMSTQLLFRPVENVLYGIFLVFLYTTVLDKMLLLGTTKTEVKMISEKWQEIADAIMKDVDRGVTLIDAEGGYNRAEKQIVLSVISNRELPKLERVVHQIDPECFMIVTRTSQVKGKGFSLSRES